MTATATWKPHDQAGELNSQKRDKLPESVFAFPKQRKAPLINASDVSSTLARFEQVEGVLDADRDLAFRNIQVAAEHYDVHIKETDWRQLGATPHTLNSTS